jgi:hypothetical protein
MSRLHLRELRLGRIRRRAWIAAATLFVAMWIALFAQLASGHDPALVARKARTRTATAQAPTQTQPSPQPSQSTPMAVVDPQTGQLVDANTGAPVQIDPSTGQAVDPSTGVAVDPQTGEALDGSGESSSQSQSQSSPSQQQQQPSVPSVAPQPSYQPAPMVTQQS